MGRCLGEVRKLNCWSERLSNKATASRATKHAVETVRSDASLFRTHLSIGSGWRASCTLIVPAVCSGEFHEATLSQIVFAKSGFIFVDAHQNLQFLFAHWKNQTAGRS